MKITVATKIEEELKKKLEKSAKENDRTISQEINRRLKKSYERK